jgi:DNA-binding NarL/FixJ family response regulator
VGEISGAIVAPHHQPAGFPIEITLLEVQGFVDASQVKPYYFIRILFLTLSGNVWDCMAYKQGEGRRIMGIRIIIANDHQIFRQGLRALLEKEPDMEVVAEAEDGRKTLTLVRELTPHLVTLDVNLPDLNGIEASRQILSEYPETKVIALPMHFDRHDILNMLKAGVHGYLFKDCVFEELVRAIRLVMSNKTYLSPEVAGVVVKEYVTHDPGSSQSAFSLLTGREQEVLQLMAEGESTKQIAELLNIGVKTAETHRQKIVHKLGTSSVAKLTKIAIREGLTSLED